MTISTFAELKTAIQSWMLERTDLAPKVEDFITLAEADINKLLDTTQMEGVHTYASTDFTSGAASLPADYRKARAVLGAGYPREKLTNRAPWALVDLYPIPFSGIATDYSIAGDGAGGRQITVMPYPTHDVQLQYYAKITPLSDGAPSNWLLTEDPYCYLSGACRYAARFLRSAKDEADFKADFVERIGLVLQNDRDGKWGNYQSEHVGRPRP